MEEYIGSAVGFLTSAMGSLNIYMVAIGAVLAALVAIAKLTKTDKDDKIMAKAVAIYNKMKGYMPKSKPAKAKKKAK